MKLDAYTCEGQITFDDLVESKTQDPEQKSKEKPKETDETENLNTDNKKGFDWSDETFKCSGCINATFKEQAKIGAIYYCHKKHSIITETTGSWLCHNEHYERRK